MRLRSSSVQNVAQIPAAIPETICTTTITTGNSTIINITRSLTDLTATTTGNDDSKSPKSQQRSFIQNFTKKILGSSSSSSSSGTSSTSTSITGSSSSGFVDGTPKKARSMSMVSLGACFRPITLRRLYSSKQSVVTRKSSGRNESSLSVPNLSTLDLKVDQNPQPENPRPPSPPSKSPSMFIKKKHATGKRWLPGKISSSKISTDDNDHCHHTLPHNVGSSATIRIPTADSNLSLGCSMLTFPVADRDPDVRYLTYSGAGTGIHSPPAWPPLTAEFRLRRNLRRLKRRARKLSGHVWSKSVLNLTKLVKFGQKSSHSRPSEPDVMAGMSRASSLTSLLDLIEEANKNLLNGFREEDAKETPPTPPMPPPRSRLKRAQSSINVGEGYRRPEPPRTGLPRLTTQTIDRRWAAPPNATAETYRIAFDPSVSSGASSENEEDDVDQPVVSSQSNDPKPPVLDKPQVEEEGDEEEDAKKKLRVRSHFQIQNDGTIYLEDSDWEMCSVMSDGGPQSLTMMVEQQHPEQDASDLVDLALSQGILSNPSSPPPPSSCSPKPKGETKPAEPKPVVEPKRKKYPAPPPPVSSPVATESPKSEKFVESRPVNSGKPVPEIPKSKPMASPKLEKRSRPSKSKSFKILQRFKNSKSKKSSSEKPETVMPHSIELLMEQFNESEAMTKQKPELPKNSSSFEEHIRMFTSEMKQGQQDDLYNYLESMVRRLIQQEQQQQQVVQPGTGNQIMMLWLLQQYQQQNQQQLNELRMRIVESSSTNTATNNKSESESEQFATKLLNELQTLLEKQRQNNDTKETPEEPKEENKKPEAEQTKQKEEEESPKKPPSLNVRCHANNRFVNKIVLNNSINQYNFGDGSPVAPPQIVNLLTDNSRNQAVNRFDFGSIRTESAGSDTESMNSNSDQNRPHRTVLQLRSNSCSSKFGLIQSLRYQLEKKRNKARVERLRKEQQQISVPQSPLAQVRHQERPPVTLANTSSIEIRSGTRPPPPLSTIKPGGTLKRFFRRAEEPSGIRSEWSDDEEEEDIGSWYQNHPQFQDRPEISPPYPLGVAESRLAGAANNHHHHQQQKQQRTWQSECNFRSIVKLNDVVVREELDDDEDADNDSHDLPPEDVDDDDEEENWFAEVRSRRQMLEARRRHRPTTTIGGYSSSSSTSLRPSTVTFTLPRSRGQHLYTATKPYYRMMEDNRRRIIDNEYDDDDDDEEPELMSESSVETRNSFCCNTSCSEMDRISVQLSRNSRLNARYFRNGQPSSSYHHHRR